MAGDAFGLLARGRQIAFELDDLGYEFPKYPVPEGESMDSFLRKRVEEGVQHRYGPKNDRALLAAGRVAAHTGVRVFMDRYAPRLACGRGRFTPTRIPYFPEAALPLLGIVPVERMIAA